MWRLRREEAIPYATVFDSDLGLTHGGLFARAELALLPWLTVIAGARADVFAFSSLGPRGARERSQRRAAAGDPQRRMGHRHLAARQRSPTAGRCVLVGRQCRHRRALERCPGVVRGRERALRARDFGRDRPGDRICTSRRRCAWRRARSRSRRASPTTCCSTRSAAATCRSAPRTATARADRRGSASPISATRSRASPGPRRASPAKTTRSSICRRATCCRSCRAPCCASTTRAACASTSRAKRCYAGAAFGLSFIGPRPLPLGAFSESVWDLEASIRARWRMVELALSFENLLDARNRIAEFNHASNFAGADEPSSLRAVRHFAAGPPRQLAADPDRVPGRARPRAGRRP